MTIYAYFLGLGSLVLLGCGGNVAAEEQVPNDAGTSDSSTKDSAIDATLDANVSDTPTELGIWPPSASQLVAINAGGGEVMPGPAGSECEVGKARYELMVGQSSLSWSVCDWSDPKKPYKMVNGARIITPAERKAVSDAMLQVKIAQDGSCGADKPMLSILVTSPSGVHEYVDSFYQCMGGGKVYVDGIDGVFGVLQNLAK